MVTRVYLEGKKIQMRMVVPDHFPIEPGWRDLDVPEDYTEYYYENNSLKRRPPSPSEHHEFNYSTCKWELNLESYWRVIREFRDKRISASDWTQLPDIQSNMSDELKLSWATYRQALRDITEQEPLKIVWPTPPN